MTFYKYICIHLVNNEWVKENFWYAVDPKTVDFDNDWRFKEIPGKRMQLIPCYDI